VSEPIDRRRLLVRAGTLAVAPGALAAWGHGSAKSAAGGWDDVRAQFALAPRETNLTTFLLASHPQPVREASERYRRALDADAARYLAAHEDGLDAATRRKAARYLDTSADQVALTDSTTMGLGLLYAGVRLRHRQALVTSVHDFYATQEALRYRAERSGALLSEIQLYARPDRASVDEIVSNVKLGLGPQARVLALTWVHSSTGVKIPVREIAGVVAEANRNRDPHDRILFALDGVHALGVENVAPDELGVDFLVSGTHKWLFGPRGTGIAWGRRDAWAEVDPTIPTFDRRDYGAWLLDRSTVVPPGPLMTPGGFHSFEHRWALADAFRWRFELGRRRTTERTHALAQRFVEQLADACNLTVVTPRNPALSAGLVCVAPFNARPDDAVDALYRRHRIVASVTLYATAYVRFGPSILNDEREVDAAARALRAIA
jgi:selenocysteine lyase/cysteine desulfurase